MNVVVTGGAGFIGANLCRRLVADPNIDRVIAFDDLSSGFRSNLDGLDVDLVEGTFVDLDTITDVVKGAQCVVHLGARPSVPRSVIDPLASHHANATGTIHVLEAARAAGDCQVIVASSSSVYGSNPSLPKHEDLATRPLSPYAANKLVTEGYALAYGSSYGMSTLAFRFFNVFGPLQAAGHAYAAVIPAFVSAALTGEPVTIHGDGTQTRDFTYVDTVTDVIAHAVTNNISSSEPINLAYGSRTSLLEVLDLLETLLGHPIERIHTENRVGDVPHSQASNERLLKLFSEVAPTSLEQGLSATIDWFKSNPVQK